MSATSSLKRNLASVALGNGLYALSQFGMLSILAKRSSVHDVGLYALALAISAPVFLFFSLKLRQVQATDAEGTYSFQQYLGLRILTSGVAMLVAMGVGVFVSRGLGGSSLLVIFLVVLNKAFESLVDTFYGYCQRREEMALIAKFMTTRAIASLVVFGSIVWFVDDLVWALVGLVCTTAVQSATIALRIRSEGVSLRPELRPSRLLHLARLSFPLGVAVAVGSLIANVPRYSIQGFLSSGDLGVYAAISYCLVATGLVTNAMGQSASPRLANLYRDRLIDQFRHITRRLLGGGVLLGLVGMVASLVAGRWALGLFFGPSYAHEWKLLVVLMGAALLQYPAAFVGTAINAVQLFKIQAPINLLVLAVSGLSSVVLVSTLGLVGAALAVVLGQLTMLLAYAAVYHRSVAPLLRARAAAGEPQASND